MRTKRLEVRPSGPWESTPPSDQAPRGSSNRCWGAGSIHTGAPTHRGSPPPPEETDSAFSLLARYSSFLPRKLDTSLPNNQEFRLHVLSCCDFASVLSKCRQSAGNHLPPWSPPTARPPAYPALPSFPDAPWWQTSAVGTHTFSEVSGRPPSRLCTCSPLGAGLALVLLNPIHQDCGEQGNKTEDLRFPETLLREPVVVQQGSPGIRERGASPGGRGGELDAVCLGAGGWEEGAHTARTLRPLTQSARSASDSQGCLCCAGRLVAVAVC